MIRIRGIGPLYWGVEHTPADRSIWTRAWLVEDLPPYRRSTHGWRVRVGEYAVHLGLCKRAEDPHRRMQVKPNQIGKWGGHRDAKANYAEHYAAADNGDESVRLVGFGGRVHGAGDDDHGPPAVPGRVPPAGDAGRPGEGAGRDGPQVRNSDGGTGDTS